MKATKLKDVILYKECPFTEDILIIEGKRKSIIIGAKTNGYASIETGELLNIKTLETIHKEYDNEKFIKLYLDNLKMMLGLSRPALNVLTCLFNNIKPNTTQIFLTIDSIQEYCNYKTHNPVVQGLIELISKSIIARGHMKVNYFLNPAFAFNGNRLRVVKEYHRIDMKMEADVVDGTRVVLFSGEEPEKA